MILEVEHGRNGADDNEAVDDIEKCEQYHDESR